MTEENPYQVSAVSDEGSLNLHGEGSYTKLFLRLARYVAPFFGGFAGVVVFLFMTVRQLSLPAATGELAGAIFFFLVMAFAVFGVVTVTATLLLLLVGFVVGLIVDVVVRMTSS